MNTNAVATRGGDKKEAGNESWFQGGKYLTFFLAGEEYGIEILKVQEIIGLMPVTRVPQSQNYIRGVINLRGKVITVVDMRLKFGLPEQEPTPETCIVVVKTGEVEMGIIVDRVKEVLDIRPEEMEAAPSFGADVDTKYLKGIGKTQGRVRLLLDIDCVVAWKENSELPNPDGVAVNEEN